MLRRTTSARVPHKTLQPHDAMSLLGMPDFTSFCSTPPPTWTLASKTLTGIRLNTCATPRWDGQSGSLADTIPNPGYEPNFCIDVSSEHTPINYPYRKNRLNLENDLTTTVAATEDSDHLPQRSAPSGSQQAEVNAVSTWLSGTRKPVRGNDSVASVEESVLRGKEIEI